MPSIKKVISYIFIGLLASLSAANYITFVFPNSFAPTGLDGICTMIQDVLDINMGYLSLLGNIPLLICAYLYLNRSFAAKTLVYVLSFSFAVIFLKESVIADFAYHTESGSSTVLAPIAAGVIRGILYFFTLKLNSCAGGMDIVAAIVKKKKPHLDFMSIIFVFNMCIAFASYFVYGMNFDPVICSILYAFIISNTGKQMQNGEHETIKFEIITSDADSLYKKISKKLHIPATIMEAHGAYSGEDKEMIICVTDKPTAPFLEEILREFPDSVVFKSITDNSQMLVDYSKSGV